MAGITNNGEITNEGRAVVAEMAMSTLNDQENVVVDLLANIMHYCDQRGEDFKASLKTASMHFEQEKEEEAGQ